MTLRLGGDGAITGCTSLEEPTISISGLTMTTPIEAVSGTAAAPSYTFSGDTDNGLYYGGTNSIGVSTAGTSAIFVDASQQIGIGTTSPAERLHVAGDVRIVDNSPRLGFHDANASGLGDATGGIEVFTSGGNRSCFLGATEDVGVLSFGTNNTERMRINISGNVGIGETSPAHELHVAGAVIPEIVVEDTTNNCKGYLGSSDTNGRVGTLTNHDFSFRTNNTERMRIDTSGRLLIGRTESYTTDTSVKLQIQDGSGPRVSLSAGQVSTGSLLGAIDFGADEGQGRGAARISAYSEADFNTDDYPAQIRFETTPDNSGTRVQRMKITSEGYLQAKGNVSSYYPNFPGHQIRADRNDTMLLVSNTASSISAARGGIHIIYDISPNSVNAAAIAFDDSSGPRFAVRSNGGVANYQSNDSNLCDEREKKNIEPLDSTWNCLKNWDLKKFHYNEDSDTDNKRYGVIAQQVAEGCPELITEWIKQEAADAVLDDEGNVVTPAKQQIVRMGVKEQQMMWMSIKALQEAIAKIETLEQRLSDAGIA